MPRPNRQSFTCRVSPCNNSVTTNTVSLADGNRRWVGCLYAWLRRPDVFGLAGAMSPSLWFGRERLFDFVARAPVPRGRLYLDVGTAEGESTLRDSRALWEMLQGRATARYLEDEGAGHDEAAWGRRLSGALEFLLGGR